MKINKTLHEWQHILSSKNAPPNAFEVTRNAATEAPFTGLYWNHWDQGRYKCICCEHLLFLSDHKFDASCGWPSFSQTANANAVTNRKDTSHGMVRTEILCSQCDAHLGHVFDDGPAPNGLRFCINSSALSFTPS